MRYSSIISIVALGLASFSVAAPVGSNLPDGKGDGGPSDSPTGPLGSVKDLPNSLISGLTGGKYSQLPNTQVPLNETVADTRFFKDGKAGVGGLIGGGSLGSASSPKRDIESSPESKHSLYSLSMLSAWDCD